MADHYNQVGRLVYQTYLLPAKSRGDLQVTIPVSEVWKALGCVYPVYFIRDVLESRRFRDTYHVSLATLLPDEFFPVSFTFTLDAERAASA